MLARGMMLTTKFRIRSAPGFGCVVGGLLLLAGCAPSGPEALLDGERLIREGKFPEAVDKLKLAAQILPANAQAWNHLGLAHHGNRQPVEAAQAYRQALQRNPNLPPVHYNLGLLALEQNDLATAINELTTFTVLERGAPDGWFHLGTAQWRAGQIDAAEQSFQNVLRIEPGRVDAQNNLGVIQAHRRRVRESIAAFTSALQSDPDHAAAALNLAVMIHPFDKPLALQRYRNYLARHSTSAQADQVRAIVRQLERELAPAVPPVPPVPAPAIVQTAAPPTGLAQREAPPSLPARSNAVPNPVPASNTLAATTPRSVSTNPPAPVTRTPEPQLVRSEPAARDETARPAAAPMTNAAVKVTEAPRTLAAPPPIEVRVADPAPPRTVATMQPPPTPQTNRVNEPLAQVSATPPLSQTNVSNPPSLPPADSARPTPPATGRRTVGDRLNPANWFSRPPPITTPLGPLSNPPPDSGTAAHPGAAENLQLAKAPALSSLPVLPPAQPVEVRPPAPRYRYLNPARPVAGNRELALDAVSRGVTEHRRRELTRAVELYRESVRIDPALYEGHFNLGLAAAEMKNWSLSLSAYETALSIRPSAIDARLNFAEVLEAAGYLEDSKLQLERVLAERPDETRAHFTLGRLLSSDPSSHSQAARHYRRVLELEPQHSQAAALRYWLQAHTAR